MQQKVLIKSQHEKLVAQRRLYEPTWQECLDYGMPLLGDVTTEQSEGSDRMDGLLDTTMMQGCLELASNLKSEIVPSGSQWLRIRPPRELRGDREVMTALSETQERIVEEIERSNFYTVSATALLNQIVIANSCTSVKEKRLKLNQDGSTWGGLAFRPAPMKDVAWSFGPDGDTDAVFFEYELEAHEADDFFDGNAGSEVRELLEGPDPQPTAKVKFVHCVHENRGAWKSPEIEQDYVARYFTKGKWELLKVEGHSKLRYICTRWFVVSEEAYGRGLGNIVRPDAKGADQVKRNVYQALDMATNPPLGLPSPDYFDYDFGPGGTFVRDPEYPENPQYLESGVRLDYAQAVLSEDRSQIQAGLMMDAFRPPETEPRSAYESRRRDIQVRKRLATPADQIQKEYLEPVVDNVISLMESAGKLPELSRLLEENDGGMDLTYVFVSPFFLAQRQENVERSIFFENRQIEKFQATQDERHLDWVDPDRSAMFLIQEAEVPDETIPSEEEIVQGRLVRSEQQQQQAQLEQQEQASKVAANIGRGQRDAAAAATE